MQHVFRLAMVCTAAALSASTASAQCVTASSEGFFFAPYDVVFDTIIDTESYPDWNPYITEVNPADADLTNIGEQFTLTVFQPLWEVEAFVEEIVTDVIFPSGGIAKVEYAFDRVGNDLAGFPTRPQSLTSIFGIFTYYETAETLCGSLRPGVIRDVQAGFDAQTAALGAESFYRFIGGFLH